jgi:hypothetical protein
VEFDNADPFVYTVTSNKKIFMKDVEKYFKITEGFSKYRDSITFIDGTDEIDLDKFLKE